MSKIVELKIGEIQNVVGGVITASTAPLAAPTTTKTSQVPPPVSQPATRRF
jgi:hypothetical protein